MSFPWDIAVLTAVLGLNRILVPSSLRRPALFWTIQAVDLTLALLVLVFGLPGLGSIRVAGWLVGGLLVFHVVQNLAMRQAELGRAEREIAERERLRKLRSLEPPAPPNGPDTHA
jgi:hypothetical protein